MTKQELLQQIAKYNFELSLRLTGCNVPLEIAALLGAQMVYIIRLEKVIEHEEQRAQLQKQRLNAMYGRVIDLTPYTINSKLEDNKDEAKQLPNTTN